MTTRFLLPVLLLPLSAACALRPSRLALDADMIVVKSVRLPDRDWLPWITRFAEHCWLEVRDDGGWHRIEWNRHLDHVQVSALTPADAAEDQRWERGVAVVASAHGPAVRGTVAALLRRAPDYPDAAGYRAWPGPNSNTFVDWLLREVSGFGAVLPPNAVGRDYAWPLRLEPSCSGTGMRLDTPLLGAGVGLREGVEVHVLGLVAGIRLWPPAIELPFLPAIPGGWFGD